MDAISIIAADCRFHPLVVIHLLLGYGKYSTVVIARRAAIEVARSDCHAHFQRH